MCPKKRASLETLKNPEQIVAEAQALKEADSAYNIGGNKPAEKKRSLLREAAKAPKASSRSAECASIAAFSREQSSKEAFIPCP